MKLKPIRSGYKLWCLNLDNGYLYTFEVYQGAGSQSQYQAEYGHGPGVVLGLMDHLPEGNWELYLDNFLHQLSCSSIWQIVVSESLVHLVSK